MKKVTLMLLLGGWAAISQADVLVDFYQNPSWVTTGNVNAQGLSSGSVPFSMTSVRSPATGYTGPVFYGGATSSVAIAAASWSVGNATPDYLNASLPTGTNIGRWVSAVWMFTNQAATITQLVYDVRAIGSGSAISNFARVVVQKNGSLYISDIVLSKATSGPVTNSNPGALSWYNYDPANGMTNIGSLVSEFQLTDITAVGEYVMVIQTNNTSTSMGAATRQFTAYGSVIPEPATIGLLGLGAFVLLARRMNSQPK